MTDYRVAGIVEKITIIEAARGALRGTEFCGNGYAKRIIRFFAWGQTSHVGVWGHQPPQKG